VNWEEEGGDRNGSGQEKKGKFVAMNLNMGASKTDHRSQEWEEKSRKGNTGRARKVSERKRMRYHRDYGGQVT